MSDQNKDSLEEFFRKSAEECHFEFQETDWNEMEHKLDGLYTAKNPAAFDNNTGIKYYLTGIIFVKIILLFSIFFFRHQSPSGEMSAEKVIQHPMNHQMHDISANRKKEVLPREKNVESDHPLRQSNAGIVAKHPGFAYDEESLQIKPVNTVPASGNLAEILQHTIENSNEPKIALSLSEIFDINDENQEEILNIKKRQAHEWSMGLLIAPDFSTVGLSTFSRPGKRIGVAVDYHLSPGIVLRTALVMVNNLYTAGENQYNPPVDYWPGNNRPVSTDAECNILDIPISIRYNFATISKNKFYAGAGLSSYIMLKEKYQFRYSTGNYYNQQNPDMWESENTSSHLFGLIGVSAGFEREISPKMSLQIEPFLNAPLNSIGWGNVNLYSTGIYFSLRYHWKGQ
ncbi:MAG: hypothetical protein JJU28_07895 [Cyclobacteriaceae bacterium]|nr:hypothetical protein [Cyclobacteriaceae bacterium]